MHFVHIADAGTELRQYRAGQLDATYVVPPQQFRWIQEHLAAELHMSPQLSIYYYGFNLTRPPFKDNPGLRRALSLVIDRDKLTSAITGVGEAPAYGWVPRGVWNYTPQQFDYAALPYSARVAEARAALPRAGYSAARPLQVELRYNTGDVHNRLAVAVASMWKDALGVETTLYAEEFRALLQTIQARNDTQVFRSSWVGDYNDAFSFAQLLQIDFGINLTGYSNPRYDALLAAAVRQSDPARRRALLEEAERVMLADHPVLPLYFYVNKHLVKPWVRGWADNVMNVAYSKDVRLGIRPEARVTDSTHGSCSELSASRALATMQSFREFKQRHDLVRHLRRHRLRPLFLARIPRPAARPAERFGAAAHGRALHRTGCHRPGRHRRRIRQDRTRSPPLGAARSGRARRHESPRHGCGRHGTDRRPRARALRRAGRSRPGLLGAPRM